jgi:hypothetical protein
MKGSENVKTIRTQKRSSIRHSGKEAEAVSDCHNAVCSQIEKEKKRIHSWHDLQNTKSVSRWRAGTCLICGEYMSGCITHYHAELHGFKSAEEMIEAGAIRFD